MSSPVTPSAPRSGAVEGRRAAQTLTPDQKKALQNLHQAATQFEGVFLQMVMGAMRETVPTSSIFGQDSASEKTWQSMLDDEYSQQMAGAGGFGLAAQLEQQMRATVLSDPAAEAHTNVDQRRIQP
ncbi:MAG TPA: rod-binding protein [Candidatus Baltobacteraceae bacterium]|nr:rod-binding protein [Candidatus Baltobacteraceae bacterium]